MADSKISALTETTTVGNLDALVLARSGTTRKVDAINLQGYVRSSAYVKVVDQKPEATTGGTFTSLAWQTRDLNTIQWDIDSLIVSLAANRLTLVAGTYECRIYAPVYATNRARLRLRNITDSTTVLTGASGLHQYQNGNGGQCWMFGRFTIAASKALEVQHVCQTTSNTYGFGVPMGDVFAGIGPEVYTEAEFWLIG